MARAILLDWRTWVGAFVVMFLAGLLGALIENPSAGTAGGGGLIGLIIATRSARLRRCAKCGAIVGVPSS